MSGPRAVIYGAAAAGSTRGPSLILGIFNASYAIDRHAVFARSLRPSAPHATQLGPDINRLAKRCGLAARAGAGARPRAPSEMPQDRRRNEARARGIDVAVAVGSLLMGEEALRHDQAPLVLGARHRDVEGTPLLLDLGARSGSEGRRQAAVHDVENEHRLPFLPLGGMDGGEDEIVFILERHAGLVAGGVGRIEREVGQEPLAA